MRALHVTDGVVDNVIVVDDELPDGWAQAPVGVGIGWTDNGDGTFTDPSDTTTDEAKLAVAKFNKNQQLERASIQEATGNFGSSVLGSPHTYSLAPERKLRLIELAIGSKRHEGDGTWKQRLWCTPEGHASPQLLWHTAQQLQDLHDEVLDWLDDRQDHLDIRLDQVEAVEITTDLETALADVALVVW